MITDNNNILCCCEYLDIYEERNHILACCCNCQDFDEGFESFISGQGFPKRNRTGCMATLHDRFRIPWKGGAKRISLATTVSIISLPTFLVLASLSPLWTVISAAAMICFLIIIKYKLLNYYPRSKFFYVWMNTSYIVLYLIFEFVVIPFLEILWEENIALTIVIALSCFWFWKVKTAKIIENFGRSCPNCTFQVSNDSRHHAWLDCCVGRHNSRQYIFGLLSAITALLYGCNLTLTTVCHPFTWFATVLLPDDCSDAYDLFELSLSFVSGLYSLGVAMFLCVLLIYQLILITCRKCVGSSASKKISDNFIA